MYFNPQFLQCSDKSSTVQNFTSRESNQCCVSNGARKDNGKLSPWHGGATVEEAPFHHRQMHQ